MHNVFTSSPENFVYFFIAGVLIVYLILKYDSRRRRDITNILQRAHGVQPLIMKKHVDQKLKAFKAVCNYNKGMAHSPVAKQVNEIITAYKTGHIRLPEYCNQIERLLDDVA
jgi:hypothetical protein